MIDIIDKYLNKFINACDGLMEHLIEGNDLTRENCAAYVIQTAYRKYLIRKYLKLKQEVVKDEQVWHMNIVN
jgi:hypothetical protein